MIEKLNFVSRLIQEMKIAFEKAITQFFFKKNVIEEIQRIAVNTLTTAEQAYEEKIVDINQEANQRIDALSQQLDNSQQEKNEAIEQLALLDKKLQRIIAENNQERKNAAARANRYKAKYERLLDDLNAWLPGARELLVNKVISQQEKTKRLTQIEEKIAQQKKSIQKKTYYDPEKYRDVYLPGYGKECAILKALLEKKQRLAQKKSY